MLRRLRIQFASDLHLEMRGPSAWPILLKPVAPVLALAGDVGNPSCGEYRNFLHWCSRNWDAVFVVAGNHELYNKKAAHNWKHMPHVHTADERLTACRRSAAEFPNVRFLQQDRSDYGGVAFLGATLWTDLSNPAVAEKASEMMNDYQRITATGILPVTPADVTAWHRADYAWLNREISACAETGQPAVVITHHLPSQRLIHPRYVGHPINPAFASDCEALIRSPVRAWIAGHTHCGVTQYKDGVALLVNPLGYPGEQDTGYCRELFVDITTEAAPVDERLPELVASAATAKEEEVVMM